jgi:tRNA(Leu) C34 or U34 (ribose-2'-O)-methylase TrmL
VLPDKLFAELSPVATPTGILAEAAWLEPPAVAGMPLVMVLEDIQDPGNLGSMLRTGAAAGATLAVLSKGCTDAWSPKALRGGQGAQFVLPLLLAVELDAWLALFDGQRIALTLAQNGDFYTLDLTTPLAIIVGNEGAGLSESVRRAASIRTQIPMTGRVESLNASAALAVAVFEAARQRRTRTSLTDSDLAAQACRDFLHRHAGGVDDGQGVVREQLFCRHQFAPALRQAGIAAIGVANLANRREPFRRQGQCMQPWQMGEQDLGQGAVFEIVRG